MGMPRLTSALVLIVLLLVGCGTAEKPTAGDADALFQRRARDVVKAWSEGDMLERCTSLVPAQGLTIEPDWTPRGTLKASFAGGWVRTATALPTTPGTGEVRYADGTVVKVRTLDAQAAYDAMLNPARVSAPAGGRVRRLRLGDGHRRGGGDDDPAHGPRLRPGPRVGVHREGLPEPIMRVSVEDAAEPSDFEPALPPVPADGRRILLNGQDVVTQDPTSITVTVGSGDCDSGVRPHVLESPDVVVVGGTALGPPPDRLCNAMLRLHELEVAITEPVGSRPIVDAASGRPLLPRVAPLPICDVGEVVPPRHR